MAGIFPRAARGGVAPGPSVINGYIPTHPVTGEGPLYISPDCTTVLTDETLNSLISEILAAVDCLGFPYNSGRIDNLCEALRERFQQVADSIAGFVNRSGDVMTGPLGLVCPPSNDNEAACKLYVDEEAARAAAACCAAVRQEIADVEAGLQTQINNRVRRDGDQMTGPLILSEDPSVTSNPNQAATKNYVDERVGMIVVAPDQPVGALPDTLWWNSTTGALFVRYDDSTSVQWVQVGGVNL